VLAAGGSATASSALAVIIFPVEALGAFNISIFGLHGRTPRALSSGPNPSTFPTRSLRSAIREAGLVQYLAGCYKQKGGVPKSHQKRASEVQVAFCLYPSFLYTQLRRIDHVRDTEHFQTPTVPTTVTRLPVFGSSTRILPSSWKHLPVTSSEIRYGRTKQG
jgi:hypothetical protein